MRVAVYDSVSEAAGGGGGAGEAAGRAVVRLVQEDEGEAPNASGAAATAGGCSAGPAGEDGADRASGCVLAAGGGSACAATEVAPARGAERLGTLIKCYYFHCGLFFHEACTPGSPRFYDYV